MKIEIGTEVKAKIGSYKGQIGTVTTIIKTTRKRFYVTFGDGNCTSYWFTNLTTKLK